LCKWKKWSPSFPSHHFPFDGRRKGKDDNNMTGGEIEEHDKGKEGKSFTPITPITQDKRDKKE